MKKDHRYVELLLERYLEAQTSVEEETWLRNYFLKYGNEVSSQWYWARDLFVYSGQEVVHNEAKNERSIVRALKRSDFYRIAATVALLIVTSLSVYRLEMDYRARKMHEAYTETKKAFVLIAEQFEFAQEQTQYLDYIDQSIKKVLNQ